MCRGVCIASRRTASHRIGGSSRYTHRDLTEADAVPLHTTHDRLCFTMIPRHVQAMTTGSLGVAWAAYLSFVTHTEAPPVAATAAGGGGSSKK